MDILASATHPVVRPEDMSTYFWKHLVHDIDVLSKAIGHSVDETTLVIHLILQEMYNSTYNGKPFMYTRLPSYGGHIVFHDSLIRSHC